MTSEGFAAIPRSLLFDTEVSSDAKLVYLVLSAVVGGTMPPTHKRIGEVAGISSATVKRRLTELRERGHVEWDAPGEHDVRRPVHYRLVASTTPMNADSSQGAIDSSVRAMPRPEVVALCARLADRIEANGSKRPTVGKTWLDACRLLLDADGKTVDQVERAIDWCQQDEFWRGNVLSMPTLRKQYEKLRLAAQRDHAQKTRAAERERAKAPTPVGRRTGTNW